MGAEPRTAGPLALVLHGGGARAAYQVGFLRAVARRHADLRVPIITGVSSGAINAAHLAAFSGAFSEAVEALTRLWRGLDVERVFRVDSASLLTQILRWGWRLASGGGAAAPDVRSLVDTAPLRHLLTEQLAPAGGEIEGIARNLSRGALSAVAVTTSSYSTGRAVTWVQGCDIQTWERPDRESRETRLTVDHVMASSALPMFFPAVHIEGGWYGDGAMRMTAPFAPAVHLGAHRIMTISTRFRPHGENPGPRNAGYPPPMQIAGQLLNAVFLDALDEDALRLERTNSLLRALPPEKRGTMRPLELLVIRPSRDLGRLSSAFEARLPGFFRYLARGLGSRETASPDLLSFLMFQPDYLQALIDIGEADATAHGEAIEAFLR